MLDEELKEEVKKTLPKGVKTVFSSVAQQGLTDLKDLIWSQLMLDRIIKLDQEVFLLLNGAGSEMYDTFGYLFQALNLLFPYFFSLFFY